MVKKRNRDPEVLPEAPSAQGGDNDSGSDDVRFPTHDFRSHTNPSIGCGYGQC